MIINKLQLNILKSRVICLCHLAIYSEIIKWQGSLERSQIYVMAYAAFQTNGNDNHVLQMVNNCCQLNQYVIEPPNKRLIFFVQLGHTEVTTGIQIRGDCNAV